MAGITRSSSSASSTSGPGTGLHPADVEEVGALADELLGLGEEPVEVEVAALVEERVGGAVEDAHHERPVAHVEAVGPERDGGARHLPHDRPRQGLHGRRTYRGAPRGHHGPRGSRVDDEAAGHRRRSRTASEPRSIVAAPSASTCDRARRVGAAHERPRPTPAPTASATTSRSIVPTPERRSDSRTVGAAEGRPAARAAEHHHVRRRRRANGPPRARAASRSGGVRGRPRPRDAPRRWRRRRPTRGTPRRDPARATTASPAASASDLEEVQLAERRVRRCARRRAPARRGPAASAGAGRSATGVPPRRRSGRR